MCLLMDGFGMELAGLAGGDKLRGVVQGGGPIEPLPESFADQIPRANMGAACSFMDVLEQLLAFVCGDAQ